MAFSAASSKPACAPSDQLLRLRLQERTPTVSEYGAVLDGAPGGMDSYYRIISDRLAQMSILGSEKDIAKSAPVWDMIRNSLAIEPPPQPKSTPQPSPAKKP